MAFLRFAVFSVLGLITLVAGLGVVGYISLQFSLPVLTGNQPAVNLAQPVQIDRDSLGVPTIQGSSRNDIAYGLGFLHAQERFFQMDLLRRNSAGELSALFGEAALEHDKNLRIHRFRTLAQQAVERLSDRQQALLSSYTDGVNQGLAKLKAWPFEYLLLRQRPRTWQIEDSFLCLFSIYLDLQDNEGKFERSRQVMKENLPEDWFRFLTPSFGSWDAPLIGQFPETELIIPESPWPTMAEEVDPDLELDGGKLNGSNGWAVSGELTATGSGLLANDMHLKLRMPNIWYRASWILPDDGRQVTGITLPGSPTMIVGSNEQIAWGFTNTYGDWSDVITLETSQSRTLYLTPEGLENLMVYDEQIEIAGQEPERLRVKWTRWGPVIGEDDQGRILVYRWVAHDPEGANLQIQALESADRVDQALTIAANSGLPQLNFIVADRLGNLGWTIMGRIPLRTTPFGQLPSDWSTRANRWQNYLAVDRYPSLRNPEQGRIWSANSLPLAGPDARRIGDSGMALGARATQIHDRLFQTDQFNEDEFLAMQLDNQAVFLQHWYQLAKQLADEYTDRIDRPRQVTKALDDWQGRAAIDSSGYRLVRHFRDQIIRQSLGRVLQQLKNDSLFFDSKSVTRRIEYPIWKLVSERPAHLVPPGHQDWTSFLIDSLNRAQDTVADLGGQTWGEENRLRMQHPLSSAIPFLANMLDMPADPLAGDKFMPNAQLNGHGSSERIVVSPGHEQQGYLLMPGGQASHPLAVYYGRGHRNWVTGEPSPFLPGPTEWPLRLIPADSEQ